MASGEYLINFDHELYIELGTTSSSVPTSTSGMTQVFNLTDASLTGASTKISVLDYDSDPTSAREAITQQSYSMPIVLNLSPGDEAYRILQEAYQTAITGGAAIKWYRKTAKIAGSTAADDAEIRAGIATVDGFTESKAVGGVATITLNTAGFGNNVWYPQGRGIATLTVATAGSGLSAATYADVALVNVGIGGLGATASITVAGGGTVEAAPTITLAGTNYNVGDVLTVALADVGGVDPDVAPTFTVATIA